MSKNIFCHLGISTFIVLTFLSYKISGLAVSVHYKPHVYAPDDIQKERQTNEHCHQLKPPYTVCGLRA